MFIPRIINPKEDEVFYSYLVRMAKANAFSTLPEFAAAYLYPAVRRSTAKNEILYDTNSVAGKFIRYFPEWVIPSDFYLAHTLYPVIAPLRTRQQQTHIINLTERRQDQFPRLVTKISSMIPELHVCPECMKEDLERNGFWYFHRAHQIEGTRVCWKHGTPLGTFRGIRNHEFDDDAHFEEISDIRSRDHEYALFVKTLLDAEVQTDLNGISKAVFSRIRELGYDTSSYDRLGQDIEEKEYTYLFSKPVAKTLKTDLISPKYVNDSDIFALMTVLFQDGNELKKYLPAEDSDEKERFMTSLSGYSLVGRYRSTVVSLKNNLSGQVFLTTPTGFLAGWKDPSADIGVSEKDKFDEIFQNVSGGKYQYMTSFDGMNNPITLKHLDCHSTEDTFRTTPRGFLEEGVRCACENRIFFSEAAEKVRQSGDFELLKYSTTDDDCVIRHLGCGQMFTVKYRKFMKSPYCRAEHPKERTQDIFAQEIVDLTGDEYALTGPYMDKDTAVRIRHNVCGREHDYLPRHFIRGQRCPFCRRELPDADFRRAVKDSTYGQYEIVGQATHNMYEIRNVETGETQQLSKDQILQEINRPTPSLILPCRQRTRIGQLQTVKDRIWDFITSHYGKDDCILLQEISVEGVSSRIIKARTQDLAREGRIRNVGAGIYVYPDKDPTPAELEEAKERRRERLRKARAEKKKMSNRSS